MLDKHILYVTTQGAKIHIDSSMVAVKFPKTGRKTLRDGLRRWPAETLERVMLFGNVQVTTQAITALLRAHVPVVFMSSSGRYRGRLVPPESSGIRLRVAQHRAAQDASFCLSMAQGWVDAKIRGGRRVLRTFARNHDAPKVTEIADGMDKRLKRVQWARSLDELRGIEGSAAAQWWRAFECMLRGPMRFERRSMRPAHNEMNALLNLLYTIVTYELTGMLEGEGLDPCLGLYHGVRAGRTSLALDVIEEFRAGELDRMALSWVNLGMFQPRDFYRAEDGGPRLKSEALGRFFQSYEHDMSSKTRKAGSVRDVMRKSVVGVRARLLEEFGQQRGG